MKSGSHALLSRGWGARNKIRYCIPDLTAPWRFEPSLHSEFNVVNVVNVVN